MTRIQRHERALWVLAAILATALIGSVAGGIGLPIERFDPIGTGPSAGAQRRAGDSANPALPPISDFAEIWGRDLRGPLYDPPPPPPSLPPRPQPKARPTVALLGIMSEPGHSRAMLTQRGGKTEMKAVGDMIDDREGPVEVLEITPESVLVGYLGERYTLTLPRENEQ